MKKTMKALGNIAISKYGMEIDGASLSDKIAEAYGYNADSEYTHTRFVGRVTLTIENLTEPFTVEEEK